jgi:hypothetical protein
VAQIVLNASLFRRQHFEQEFLPKLLTPRIIPATPDVKEKFIKRLYSMGKISHSVFARYQDACLVEARIFEGNKLVLFLPLFYYQGNEYV